MAALARIAILVSPPYVVPIVPWWPSQGRGRSSARIDVVADLGFTAAGRVYDPSGNAKAGDVLLERTDLPAPQPLDRVVDVDARNIGFLWPDVHPFAEVLLASDEHHP